VYVFGLLGGSFLIINGVVAVIVYYLVSLKLNRSDVVNLLDHINKFKGKFINSSSRYSKLSSWKYRYLHL